MSKQLAILFCALLAVVNADLADEAEQQVSELNSIVQGQILAAHDDLNNIITDFSTNSVTVEENGGVSIQQEYESISEQISTIKNLADQVNADISSCTNVREDVINRLPAQHIQEIVVCVGTIDTEATRVTSDARYTVDVIINKVNQLDFQVRQCRGDILCISPLMTEIELDKIRLPQNIQTEVQASTSLLVTLRISVQSCSDDHVANHSAQSYSILEDIITCANRIIDI